MSSPLNNITLIQTKLETSQPLHITPQSYNHFTTSQWEIWLFFCTIQISIGFTLWSKNNQISRSNCWHTIFYRKSNIKWHIYGKRAHFPLDISGFFSCCFWIMDCFWKSYCIEDLQVNHCEIVIFFISAITWHGIVNKFTRIYPVCSTYELTKQFM